MEKSRMESILDSLWDTSEDESTDEEEEEGSDEDYALALLFDPEHTEEEDGAKRIDSCEEMFERIDSSRLKKSFSDSQLSVKPSKKQQNQQLGSFSHAELLDMLTLGIIRSENLEEFMDDKENAVKIRREYLSRLDSHLAEALDNIPYQFETMKSAAGTGIKTGIPKPKPQTIQVEAKAQSEIGFIFIPLTVTEKILVDGLRYYVPMAITNPPEDSETEDEDAEISVAKDNESEVENESEGENQIQSEKVKEEKKEKEIRSESEIQNKTESEIQSEIVEAINQLEAKKKPGRDIVAHVNRGIAACVMGMDTYLFADSAKLTAIVEFPNAAQAAGVSEWFDEYFDIVKKAFESTSEILKLVDIKINPCGKKCAIRFSATVGDSADPTPILEKGIKAVLSMMGQSYSYMKTLFTRADFGKTHGKGLSADSFVPAEMIQTVLNSRSRAMVEQNRIRNNYGIGRNTAAQVVAAIFVATGQDCTRISRNSRCRVDMFKGGFDGEDLYITVTMPSIQVGTVGGGTENRSQLAALELMQIEGPNSDFDGENGLRLAKIICSCVLCAELSVMAELSQDQPIESPSTSFNPVVFGKPKKSKTAKKPETK